MNRRQLDKPVIPETLAGINPYDARTTTVLILGLFRVNRGESHVSG
jgi:hypothetical protein